MFWSNLTREVTLIAVFVSLILSKCQFVRCDNSELVLVQAYFRHGSRTPSSYEIYPNDPFGRNYFQDIGLEQLTRHGKQQMYDLGKQLRQKYETFIGNNYTRDVVYARTTDVDRTKMSILLVLAGLFPPHASEQVDENLTWMPIPYYHDSDSYREFGLAKFLCEAFDEEYRKVMSSQSTQQYLMERQEIFDYLTTHTGRNMSSLLVVFMLYQNLYSEHTMNLTLPTWSQKIFPTPLEYIAVRQFLLESSTPLLRRLNGGRSLKCIINNMKDKIYKNSAMKHRKFFLNAVHDNNLASILQALNLQELSFPKYGSALLFELHKDKTTNKHHVKILYIDEPNSAPRQLNIGCRSGCSLEDFVKFCEPHVPLNYTEECKPVRDNYKVLYPYSDFPEKASATSSTK